MKLKHIILLLAILFTLFIWTNSFAIGEVSSNQSNFVTSIVVNLIKKFSNQDVNPIRVNGAIRKFAHYFEFMICGFLYALALLKFNNKHFPLISLGILSLIASTDELIQLFRSGRNSSISDVFLDISGAVVGIFIIYFINKKKSLVV